LPRDGVLVLNKPAGITSRQAVTRVAALAGGVKAGHAGTLDPLATGVLLVCMGRATVLSGYLARGTKEYRAGILLGVETDTYDTEGRVVARRPTTGVTSEDVERTLRGLVGELEQVPPQYSAVKYDGKPLYSYARSGRHVEVPARTVFVESMDLVSMRREPYGTVADVDIVCGPGTYVRSLAHDLGSSLGCGACVAALVRTRSGRYELHDAASMHDLEEEGAGGIGARTLTFEDATADMPTVTLGGEQALAVTMGKPIPGGSVEVPGEGSVFRVLDEDGRLLALYGPARPGDEGIAARAVRVVRPYGEADSHEAA
jgi:tRNA pseudouridine55 synthase